MKMIKITLSLFAVIVLTLTAPLASAHCGNCAKDGAQKEECDKEGKEKCDKEGKEKCDKEGKEECDKEDKSA